MSDALAEILSAALTYDYGGSRTLTVQALHETLESAMAEEIIKVTIHPDGKVEMRVNGIPGMDCLAETEELAQLLGGEVEAQELTAEAYTDAEERQQDRLWH